MPSKRSHNTASAQHPKGSKLTQDDIISIEDDCKASLKHVNDLLKLIREASALPRVDISNLGSGTSQPLPVQCVHALRRVFLHYLEEGTIVSRRQMERNTAGKGGAQTNSNSLAEARRKTNSWLLDQLEKYFQILLDSLLSQEDEKLAALCLRTLMEFTGKSPSGNSGLNYGKFELNFELVCRVLVALCFRFHRHATVSLFSILQEEYIEEFDDIRLAVSRGVKRIAEMKSRELSGEKEADNQTPYWKTVKAMEGSDLSESLTELQLLVSLPPDNESWGPRSFLVPPAQGTSQNNEEAANDSESSDDGSDYESAHYLSTEGANDTSRQKERAKGHSKRKSASAANSGTSKAGDLHQQRKAFENAWLAILSLPLSQRVYRRVLLVISTDIAPNMANPLLLSDFLTNAYEVGNATSLLALSGLWYLIQSHGFEYPQFYPKLYRLLTPENVRAKYRVRFYKMLNLFMSAATLPAYLVASFAKRMARLALISPPSFSTFAIPFIYNLLKRHPACSHMVHKSQLDPRQKSLLGRSTSSNTSVSRDGFDPVTDDPSRTNALESELWELVALRRHYCPSISGVSACFERGFKGGMFDITKNSGASYESLFHQMLEPKARRGATSVDAKKKGRKKRMEKPVNKDQRSAFLSETPLAVLTRSDLDNMADGYLSNGKGFEADYRETPLATNSSAESLVPEGKTIVDSYKSVVDLSKVSTRRLNLFPLLFSSSPQPLTGKRGRPREDDNLSRKARASR
eukprot:gb/GECG01012201.1/.p1 GENE.gb/GECG01012201.1/~~gb/GECG01012201.1/.p1  ORF type:complete len:747 (+),score=100.20 gb/GECG01012201.1/:1-2241(+)